MITVSLRCTKPFCWAGEDKKPGDVVDGVPASDVETFSEWFEVVEGSQSSSTAGPNGTTQPQPNPPLTSRASRSSHAPVIGETTEGDPS